MIKFIKRLLIVSIFLFSFNLNSQNSIVIGNDNYNAWSLSGNTCYGCGSFYVMVTANRYPASDGYFYYDIYLWSNSFYSNGYAANTYIKPLIVYTIDSYNRKRLVLNFQYTVVPPKSYSSNGYFYLGYIYSSSPTQKLEINWSSASAW